MPMRYLIIPVRAIEDPQLQEAALRVLLALGVYTDRDGYCYPSQSTLARRLHVSRQAVNRQIKVLVHLGYLQVTRRKNAEGGETSCLYRIYFDEPAPLANDEAGSTHIETQQDPQPETGPDCRVPTRKVEGEGAENESNQLLSIPGIQPAVKEVCTDNESQIECLPEIDPFLSLGATLVDAQSASFNVASTESPYISPPAIPNVASPESSDNSPPASPDVAQTTQLTSHITNKRNGKNVCSRIKPETMSIPPPTSLASLHSRDPNSYPQEERIHLIFHSEMDRSLPRKSAEVCANKHSAWDSIPQNPLEVQLHPDLSVYIALTAFTPPGRDNQNIIDELRHLRTRYPTNQALTNYLMPFWQRWKESRCKDGSRYSNANSAWLTDWARKGYVPIISRNNWDLVVSRGISFSIFPEDSNLCWYYFCEWLPAFFTAL